MTAVAFGGTLRNGFVYDDPFLVVENRRLADPSSWGELFRNGSWSAAGIEARNYRPLPLLTMALNRWWGGLAPAGFHAINLLFHLAAATLLFALARRLGLSRAAAWLAAALFAVHPLQTEPVSEIVGRMDLMAGTAMLAALLAHVALRARQRDGRPAAPLAVAAVALYAAGLLSKEHVILLPAVAAVWDLHARTGPPRRWLPVHIGYAAVAAGYLALRAAIFGGELLAGAVSPLDNPLAPAPAVLRMVSALAVTGRYLAHVAVPARLSPDYCYAQILPFDTMRAPAPIVTVAVALLVTAVALQLARRSSRAALALALGAAAFLPVSNLLFPIGTVMGDRLFYLPLAALALLAGLALDRASARVRPALLVLAGVAVLAATAAARAQSRCWHDSYALSLQAVRAAPRCARGHSNLGYDLLERGDLAGARASFERSLGLYSGQPKAEVGLALVALRGNAEPAALGEARRHADRALELDPRSTAALEVAAELARRTGDLADARSLWERRLAIDPLHAVTLSNLAILDWQDGLADRAIERWRLAAGQPGSSPEIWLNLGRALASRGRSDEARAAFSRYEAARAAPRSP